MYSNEIEILRNEIVTKDAEISRKKQENDQMYNIRDTAKKEANKLMSQYREKRGSSIFL